MLIDGRELDYRMPFNGQGGITSELPKPKPWGGVLGYHLYLEMRNEENGKSGRG